MSIKRSQIHSEQVKIWETNLKSLSIEQSIVLFEKAINAVEDRSLKTLSRVTMTVVVDRALHETREKFPVLAKAKIENDHISLRDIGANFGQYKSDEIIPALRTLLIELLTVLGNITSDVLTAPLHKELMRVTPKNSLAENDGQNVSALRAVKKNREGS